MSNYGPKQVVCLKCGHMFCLRCIDASLSYTKECPVCKEPAKKSDIRRLFFTKVEIQDELAYHAMEANYMREKSARERLEMEMYKMELEIRNLRKQLTNKEENNQFEILTQPTKQEPTTRMTIETSSIQEMDNPSCLTFVECDYCKNATSQTSSFFFTSPSNQVHLIHLARSDNVQTILSCNSTISSLTSFPAVSSPMLLISFDQSLCLFDVRDRCICSMFNIEKGVQTCCCSRKPFQIFVSTQDGINEFDIRFPTRPLSFIASPPSLALYPISTMSLLQITQNMVQQYAFAGNSWTRLSRVQHPGGFGRIALYMNELQFMIASKTSSAISYHKGSLNTLQYNFVYENKCRPRSCHAAEYSSVFKPCIHVYDQNQFISTCYANQLQYYNCNDPHQLMGECRVNESWDVTEEHSLYHRNVSLLTTTKGIAMNRFSFT